MSSFKRATKPAPADSNGQCTTLPEMSVKIPGVKSWINNGMGLVSVGNKQLDDLLGGGLALGTTLLIETESYSNYGETLFLYSLSESISMQHETVVVCESTDDANKIISILPYNQTIGGASQPKHEDRLEEQKKELSIAWQYGKYLPTTGAKNVTSLMTTSSSYCCSYDLSKRMQSELTSSGVLQICDMAQFAPSSSNQRSSDLCQWIVCQVATIVNNIRSAPGYRPNVVRIFVPLNEIVNNACLNEHKSANSADLTTSIARLVLALKQLVRGTPMVVVFTLQPDTVSKQLANKVFQMADTVVSLESFAGKMHSVPYEFKEFQGFLVVGKVQQYGMVAPFRPANSRYGVKRDRRKLHVVPLHLPPEESRAFGAAGTDAQLQARSVGLAKSSGSSNQLQAEDVQIHQHKTRQEPPPPAPSGNTDHHHDHSHSHNDGCNKAHGEHTPCSGTSSTNAGASADPPIKMTPLAAKLAAARAARLAGTSVANDSGAALPVPISISANKSKTVNMPPLQPGGACGSGKANLDF